MKSSARIISLVLVFVTLFSAFSFNALADGEGHTYTGQSFWGWLLGEGTPDWLDSVVGFVSSDYCEDSPTHLHTANSYLRKTNFIEKVGSLGTFDYECQCQYCGDTFYVNEKNVAEVFQNSYGDYVDNTLPIPSINSAGELIWRPTYSSFSHGWFHYAADIGHVTCDPNITGKLSVQLLHSSNSPYIDFNNHGCICSFAGEYSLSGYYRTINTNIQVDISGTTSSNQPYSKSYSVQSPILNSFYFSGDSYSYDVSIPNDLFLFATYLIYVIDYPVYAITPQDYPTSGSGSVYNIDSRAASFTGDMGIIGDNGQLTKVDGDQIFNETTNNYYNPNTGLTIPVTDWTYDYSTRSYDLTLDTGDTVTVTYGDENITIQEGNQTYNVYYIIEHDVSPGDIGSDGHYHQWGTPTDTTPATCTNPGSETYTCSVCGESKTVQLPALGHKWKVLRTVQTKYDESGQLAQEGYTLYECERCGEQYKQDATSTGPPGGSTTGGTGSGESSDNDGESIWDKLGKLFGTLGSGVIDAIGAIISKLLDGLISLAEMIAEKLVSVVEVVLKIFDALPQLFSGFLSFLESAFSFLPDEIVLLLTFGIVAVVAIGIIKAVRR